MIDSTKPVLLMPDSSYVVTLSNGLPYNVLPSDPLWPSVRVWIAHGGMATPYVPPAPLPPDAVAQANATLQLLMLQYVNSIMTGPSAPKDLAPQWIAAWKAAGN